MSEHALRGFRVQEQSEDLLPVREDMKSPSSRKQL